MTDFAMPAALELEAARRSGIPAFRREVVHNTTTQNVYRPGELCYIPIDTGAAGAFMDVGATKLEFVVTVQNKNYFTDFINLPRCGWSAIIQEFGIELNNGLHELNRHYAECVELHMIKRGENRTPFEMCRTNPWRAADGTAGKLHINFIKPSMVTMSGLPHNVKYAPLGTLTSSTTPDYITQGYLYYSQPYIHEMLGRSTTTNFADNSKIYYAEHDMVPSTMEITASAWEDQINVQYNYQKRNAILLNQAGAQVEPTPNGAVTVDEGGPYPVAYQYKGETSDTHCDTYLKMWGLPQGPALRAMARTRPETADVSMYSLVYGQTAKGKSPGMWPACQPCPLLELEKEYKDTIRFVNADNVFNYYANVKNIPVGIPVDLDGDPHAQEKVWGTGLKTKTTIGPNGYETDFHVSVKIYSSLIGELADRWFPELVVPQGRMRVRLRFQEPNIVFQTLMDPCRRVPGTSRDFIPYTGVIKTQNIPSTGDDEEVELGVAIPVGQGSVGGLQDLKQIASGIHPLMISDYLAGSVFVDSIALGRYPLPILRMRALHTIFGAASSSWQGNGATHPIPEPTYGYTAGIESLNFPLSSLYSTNITSLNSMINIVGNPTEETSQSFAQSQIIGPSKIFHEWSQNQEYGFPVSRSVRDANGFPIAKRGADYSFVNDKPLNVSDVQYYNFGTDWQNHYKDLAFGGGIWIKPADYADGAITDPATFNSLNGANADTLQHSQNWNPFNIPTPQYVPMRSPWDKQAARQITAADYVPEEEVCYGTFLPASVAQVRRSQSALYPLKVPDANTSGIYERLTYQVKNIQIVTQQIVLPRGTALSIVENALEGGITMECRAWKEMESILPNAESQKHLINMAAAFCTDISFLFRPVQIYQGDIAYGYNSFSFYNPFTVFDFALEDGLTSESQVNALGGKPIYYNECIMSTRVPFDIQLQIATELLPRTPIDSINSLLRNCRWGGQVFSDRDYMELNPHLMPSYQTSKGMSINTLQDGFWACFTPIHCLNDQTITDNPFFVPLEFSLRKKIRGARAKGGSLPIFKPFDGTFHLSFNLEAYMGQSDRIRTGVPIVNNNMFLKLERGHLLRQESTQLLTVIQCDGKVVFERGGTVQFFT
jgi:hypothetical protein